MKLVKEVFSASVKRFIASWCAMAFLLLVIFEKDFTMPSFAGDFSIVSALLIIGAFFIFATLVRLFVKTDIFDDIFLLISVLVYAYTLVYKYADLYFYIGIMLVVAVLSVYLFGNDRFGLKTKNINPVYVYIVVGAAGLFCFGYIALQTAMRYITYSAPNFDFGIFAQMFHNMATTLLPDTTCERDMMLSHFAVHTSPIFYLILPFYWLFPSPLTLQIAQGAIVASGIIPLVLISRQLKLPTPVTGALSVAYAFYPAVYGGCFYDIHENCFLLPLILWLFYFAEKEKYIPAFAFAFLTLTVKEDAFIYVLFAGLYLILSRKKYKFGIIISVVSVAYFALVAFLMTKFGQGIMAGRFSNYITDDGGLVSVVVNLLRNPALLFSESFVSEKLLFAIQMLLPIGFLPFLTRDVSRLTLLFPFLLINIMPDYVYQHSIYFQYVFGSTAFLFYAAALNLADMKGSYRRTVAAYSLVACILGFTSMISDRGHYVAKYEATREQISIMDEAIECVPDGVSVKASSFFLPHLANRRYLYDFGRTKHDTEYIAIDLRYEDGKHEEAQIEVYEEKGYEIVYYSKGLALIVRNPFYVGENG
ncbi:MAG: DUF2079 domain-containing protein [Clostridia bacterium]|nr:DUF2079 domain-containing protein [Clostridia bacterium]